MEGQGAMMCTSVASKSKLITLGGGFENGDSASSSLRFSRTLELG